MTTRAGGLNSAVAAELRAERGAQEMTIIELAQGAGLSESTAIRLLGNQRPIRVDVLERICEALRVSPGEILRRAQARMDRADPDADARRRLRNN